MKKLFIGLTFIFSILMVSCGGPDYRAIVEKLENDPSSLTQKDYSQMIDYMDDIVSDPQKYKEANNLENPDTLLLGFILFCGFAEGEGDIPKMDEANKSHFQKVVEKIEKIKEDIQTKGADSEYAVPFSVE